MSHLFINGPYIFIVYQFSLDTQTPYSANRVPERFSPGTFDIFFASHQIFHFMVLLAALAHYLSVLKAIEHWHGSKEGGCLLSI